MTITGDFVKLRGSDKAVQHVNLARISRIDFDPPYWAPKGNLQLFFATPQQCGDNVCWFFDTDGSVLENEITVRSNWILLTPYPSVSKAPRTYLNLAFVERVFAKNTDQPDQLQLCIHIAGLPDPVRGIRMPREHAYKYFGIE